MILDIFYCRSSLWKKYRQIFYKNIKFSDEFPVEFLKHHEVHNMVRIEDRATVIADSRVVFTVEARG